MLKFLTRLDPQSIVGFVLRLPLRWLPRRHVTRVRTGLNRGARWIVGAHIHRCWLGTYEVEMQACIAALVRPGMVIWDIGANAGFHTLAFARLAGPGGRVVAFEPLAENVQNLLQHVRLNRLTNTRVVQAALAARSGWTSFAIAELNSMGRLTDQDTSYLVPVTSIDEFLAREPGARPDVLKIDVEGAEAAVLAGAAGLLSRFAPQILLAVHGAKQSRQCREILLAHGYMLSNLDGSAPGPVSPHNEEIVARKPALAGRPDRFHPASAGIVSPAIG